MYKNSHNDFSEALQKSKIDREFEDLLSWLSPTRKIGRYAALANCANRPRQNWGQTLILESIDIWARVFEAVVRQNNYHSAAANFPSALSSACNFFFFALALSRVNSLADLEFLVRRWKFYKLHWLKYYFVCHEIEPQSILIMIMIMMFALKTVFPPYKLITLQL